MRTMTVLMLVIHWQGNILRNTEICNYLFKVHISTNIFLDVNTDVEILVKALLVQWKQI